MGEGRRPLSQPVIAAATAKNGARVTGLGALNDLGDAVIALRRKRGGVEDMFPLHIIIIPEPPRCEHCGR